MGDSVPGGAVLPNKLSQINRKDLPSHVAWHLTDGPWFGPFHFQMGLVCSSLLPAGGQGGGCVGGVSGMVACPVRPPRNLFRLHCRFTAR